jgi:DNA repair protein RadC
MNLMRPEQTCFPEFPNEHQANELSFVNDGRVETMGPSALNDAEILALLLGSGRGAMAIARELLRVAGSLSGLRAMSEGELRRVKGVGRTTALQVMSGLELGRRASRVTAESPVLNQADAIAAFMAQYVEGLEIERFYVLSLNRRNRLKKCSEISSGTATATLAHPRECLKQAIVCSASALVACHNHPSGDPSPSAADMQLTRQLREAATAVDIPLVDHVIVGRRGADPLGRGYYSFREAGLL